jgi:curved DNA-binding protein CbpA
MAAPEPQQIFVRNIKGGRWGPLTPQDLERLLQAGEIPGAIQVSFDGVNFAFPGRFPQLRAHVPPELWGPGLQRDAGAPPPVLTPQAMPPSTLPAQGDLASVSGLRLYYLAASSDAGGLLTLGLLDRVVEAHFRRGMAEHVDSDHPEDALAAFLLRSRLASNEQLAQAQQALPRFGGELLGALFGLGVLNPATAFTPLAQRAKAILARGLLAGEGSFSFRPAELPAHKAMPLGNRWAVLMELVRAVPAEELRRRLADALDHPVMKSGGQVAVQDLRLTPQETRAIAYIDGVRSLNQLVHELPQDAEHFLRLAFVLRELDIVSFAATKLPSPIPPAPVPPPPPSSAAPPPPVAKPKPPQAPAAPEGFGAELDALRALKKKLEGKDHFEVLGLPQSADSGQVKAAYFKLARIHHPDTLPQGAPAELGALKEDVFATIGTAYRALGDDAGRAKYLQELKEGASEVDVAKILQAEDLFQKGCIQVKAKRYPDAMETLTDAIATNPEEGEFYAWRGIARFYAAADRRQGKAEADRDIALALKKNPRCAPAFFFQGQMARVLGEVKAAERFFKQVLDIQPDHLDAQRELRYLKR